MSRAAPPAGPDEVAIDKGSADKGDFAVGDQVRSPAATGAREFTLAGIARFGDVDSPGGATFALFDLPTAQEFVGKPGYIELDPGPWRRLAVADERAGPSIAEALGPDSRPRCSPARRSPRRTRADIQESLQFFTIFLTVVAFIALFVACFVIYNVFSITVAQRQRENALMRAIGASRRQVTVSLLVESVVVGLVGSILGLGARHAAGHGPAARRSRRSASTSPSSGLVAAPPHGDRHDHRRLLVTVLSALLPALRSGRVPPVAAMRDTAVEATAPPRAARSPALAAAGVQRGC